MSHHYDARFADLLPRMPISQPDCVPTDHAPTYRQAMLAISAVVPLSPVIVTDNVAEYIWSDPQKEWTYTKNFPPCTPPLARMLMEWRRPAAHLITAAGSRPEAFPSFAGVLVDRIAVADLADTSKDNPRDDPLMSRGFVRRMRGEATAADAHWYVALHHVSANANRSAACYYGTSLLTLDVGGICLAPPTFFAPDDSAMQSRTITGMTGVDTATVMLSFGFCHCRNVTQHTINPPSEQSRVRQRHGHLPLVSYKVLVIDPAMDGGSNGTSVTGGDIHNRLHIVKGSHAHYHPERPLFGRLSGWFWRPSHKRGSEELGTVVNDYAVGRPGKRLPDLSVN